MNPKPGSIIFIIKNGSCFKAEVIDWAYESGGQYWAELKVDDKTLYINMSYIESWYFDNLTALAEQVKEKSENIPPNIDITLRTKKIFELKKEKAELERKEIKDHLTGKDVRQFEKYYEMPSFKKRS